MTQQPSESVTFRIEWVGLGLEGAQVLAANQFAMMHNTETDEVIFSVGHLVPPILLGDEEQRQEQARSIDPLPIVTIARFALTRDSAVRLGEVVNEHVERFRNIQEDDLG